MAPSCHRFSDMQWQCQDSMEVTVRAPLVTAAFWRSRRSAAIAGIIFGVLVAMTMMRIALSTDSLQSLRTAGTSTSLMATLAGPSVNAKVYAFGRNTIRSLFSVHAMRMAAVFTLAVSTVGIRTIFDRPLSRESHPARGS